MNHNSMDFIVHRAVKDRRSGERLAPPYLTEEGMVLFDRRASDDRRNDASRAGAPNKDLAGKR